MSLSFVTLGVCAGLACALSQSAAYVFSRLFVLKSKSAVLHLLLISHVLMGTMSLLILAIIRPTTLPPFNQYALSLFAAGGFFVVAQIGLLNLMRLTSPSSIAPLLGLKIIVLAGLNLLLFNAQLRTMQWVAVVLCAAAALVLNATGGRLNWRVMLLVLATCTGYSLSDLGITKLVGHLGAPGSVRGAVLSAVLCYAMLGIVSAGVIAATRIRCDYRAFVRFGLPYTALWFTAMFMLFFAISCIGPVYAVILQSTRGLWSVLAGAVIAHLGLVHIEEQVSHFAVLRRILAALMMVGAIWLYSQS